MGCSFVARKKNPLLPVRVRDGTRSKGAWHIYTTAIFFLAFFADSSPLRPRHSARHTEDAAATPPDVGRRHRLACVSGPHATPRVDDLAAPLLPGCPRQTRGHTGTVRSSPIPKVR